MRCDCEGSQCEVGSNEDQVSTVEIQVPDLWKCASATAPPNLILRLDKPPIDGIAQPTPPRQSERTPGTFTLYRPSRSTRKTSSQAVTFRPCLRLYQPPSITNSIHIAIKGESSSEADRVTTTFSESDFNTASENQRRCDGSLPRERECCDCDGRGDSCSRPQRQA